MFLQGEEMLYVELAVQKGYHDSISLNSEHKLIRNSTASKFNRVHNASSVEESENFHIVLHHEKW